jgi:hypothetical protein
VPPHLGEKGHFRLIKLKDILLKSEQVLKVEMISTISKYRCTYRKNVIDEMARRDSTFYLLRAESYEVHMGQG